MFHKDTHTQLTNAKPGQQPVQWQANGLDDLELNPRHSKGIFPVPKTSIPTLTPTHPPFQWVPGFFYRG